MLSKEYSSISEQEYLRLEAQSPARHEYVKGDIFAMTGGTLRHNAIAGNVFAMLRQHLRDTPCRAFINDVRLRVGKANAYYYPDLFVTCAREGQPVDLTAGEVDDAVLVIEVLSDGTEAIDRREKLLAYRTLASLSEYALISQVEARVEIHRRRGDISWEKIEYVAGETVEFASVRLAIGMQDIFEGVALA